MGSTGCWVHFSYDGAPYLVSAWASEFDALKAMNATGYGRVMFLPWGMDLWTADNQRLALEAST